MSKVNGLTTRQLKELETELHRERGRLERSTAVDGESNGDGVGRRVPGSSEGGVTLALTARAHARLATVTDALTRMAAGTYGLCVRCGSGIPYGRLLALPEATHCVVCESPTSAA